MVTNEAINNQQRSEGAPQQEDVEPEPQLEEIDHEISRFESEGGSVPPEAN